MANSVTLFAPENITPFGGTFRIRINSLDHPIKQWLLIWGESIPNQWAADTVLLNPYADSTFPILDLTVGPRRNG